MVHQKLEEARAHLVSLIEIHSPQGSAKNFVTIVFDGKTGVWGPRHMGSVHILFTCEESADEKIKRMVTQADNKKCLVVVSNDKDIQYYVRSQGAKVMSVQEFLNKMSPFRLRNLPVNSRGGKENDSKEISHTLQYEITSEFKKIWLKRDTDGG